MKPTCILLLALATAPAAGAQQISVDREKVLGQYGTVAVINTPVQATSVGPGVVFTEAVSQPNVGAIRIHFTIVDSGTPGVWAVRVGTGARQWDYVPVAGETEFWSDEMPGDNATVSVISTTAKPGMKLTMDRTAGSQQPTVPKSVTIPDERQPWATVQEPFLTLGRSVVRLRFVDDVKKKVFVCTGWIVFDSQHMLTNNHCINSDAEMRSALADVDFDQGVTPLRSVRFRRLLMTDGRLDFSLLELEQPLNRPALSLGGAIAANQPLAVIEHPAGEPKQLSEKGCSVGLTSVAGVTLDKTDFEHLCDTLGGSSGSPVFDRATLRVVGLHHLGFLEGDKSVNRAVVIPDVVNAIRAKFPDLAKSGSK
jgi:hypothetical protein